MANGIFLSLSLAQAETQAQGGPDDGGSDDDDDDVDDDCDDDVFTTPEWRPQDRRGKTDDATPGDPVSSYVLLFRKKEPHTHTFGPRRVDRG